MAISKIKAIKSTPEKAIAYIMNPEKTEDGLLVSSFGCAPETAALEFQLTAKKGSQIGNRLAYHLIQAFAPEDDITPEKAHELGMEFAKKVTSGKYEFVVTTHVDKGHIHNHIIFNATSFVDRKKYHYGALEWEKNRLHRINDKICKENNLSVIEKYSGRKGKGKYEYEQDKKDSSWKAKLAKAIDAAVLKASDFDEFLSIMELEGYEVKHGKYIAFKLTWQGQEKYSRAKSLGDAYTEDAIRDRIAHKDKTAESYKASDSSPKQKPGTVKRPDSAKINLLVDLSKNIKAQESKGYERALLKSNIDNLVKSMNYLIRHNIVTPEDFSVYESRMKKDYESTRENILKLSDDLLDLSVKIKHVKNYKKNKSVYGQSLKEKGNQEFYVQHEDEILEYQTALRYFEYNNIPLSEVNKMKLHDLFEKYKSMKEEENKLQKKSVPLRNAYKELGIVKKNIEDAIGMTLSKNDAVKENEKYIFNDAER